jgi:hypothetical protein
LKETKLDDAEGEIALEPSNFKVLQVTQMGPYNILAALQESYDCNLCSLSFAWRFIKCGVL